MAAIKKLDIRAGIAIAAALAVFCLAAGRACALCPAEIPAWGALPAEPAARARALRRVVELAQACEPEPMSAASDCAAFSQLWLEKLNAGSGYRLTYAETSGMGTVALAGGGTVRRDKTHYFLADRTLCGAGEPCGAEIIIDPTYMQFLEQGECLYGGTGAACAGAEALRGLPRVLVGTRAEIKAFYAALAERVRLYSAGVPDLRPGKYDAASAASLIYSFGPNAGLRGNIEILFGNGTGQETGKK
ncbi:MAG: hypothetical protein WCK76_10265 [Elusimicrobiota bacterium]